MNIATSEASLYQLTQDLDRPLISLSVGAETLKSYVSSIIDLLIEQQLRAKVWVKLPQTKSWVNQIQRLQEEGNAETIYLCSSLRGQANFAFPNSSSKTKVVNLKINQTPILQRESCLIVSAPDFCALILAQWQKGRIEVDASGKRLQQPYLEMVSSFSGAEIASVLLGMQQNVLANQEKNAEILAFEPPLTVRTELLSSLILQQVEQQEKVQGSLNTLRSKRNNQVESSPDVLGLQAGFLKDLVRELRSPITHMKTALSLLESKQIKGEQRQRYLQMVSSQCDRQNSLISGLLGLLQLDTPIETEYLRLDDLVPGIVSTYQPLAEEKDIQLGYTIPANLPPISCPKPWFRQIIINLLNNSLQFTPPEGRVFVQASHKKDIEQVEIVVTDTGIGIASKEINRIFDSFYRTASSDRSLTGAGLGLTIVKQSIQRSGGRITVSSKPGKGTTFKILMPAVPPELV